MSTSTHVITPDLQAKLDKAREEIHSGQCITLKSHDDPKLFKKYQKIYHELVDHPRTVPGKFLEGM